MECALRCRILRDRANSLPASTHAAQAAPMAPDHTHPVGARVAGKRVSPEEVAAATARKAVENLLVRSPAERTSALACACAPAPSSAPGEAPGALHEPSAPAAEAGSRGEAGSYGGPAADGGEPQPASEQTASWEPLHAPAAAAPSSPAETSAARISRLERDLQEATVALRLFQAEMRLSEQALGRERAARARSALAARRIAAQAADPGEVEQRRGGHRRSRDGNASVHVAEWCLVALVVCVCVAVPRALLAAGLIRFELVGDLRPSVCFALAMPQGLGSGDEL